MKCPECNGTGKVTPKVNVTQDGKPVQVNCRNCMGTGKLNKFQSKQLKRQAEQLREVNRQLQQAVVGKNAEILKLKQELKKMQDNEKMLIEQKNHFMTQSAKVDILSKLFNASVLAFSVYDISIRLVNDIPKAISLLLEHTAETKDLFAFLNEAGIECAKVTVKKVSKSELLNHKGRLICAKCAFKEQLPKEELVPVKAAGICSHCGAEFKAEEQKEGEADAK